jgi:hypothetical protein
MLYFTVTTDTGVTFTVPASTASEAGERIETLFGARVTSIVEDTDTARVLIDAAARG